MSAASDAPEIRQLKSRNRALRSEIDSLGEEIRDLRKQLAEAPWVDCYDQAVDVLAVLTSALPGWPARRWAALADLIEQQAIPGRRAP